MNKHRNAHVRQDVLSGFYTYPVEAPSRRPLSMPPSILHYVDATGTGLVHL